MVELTELVQSANDGAAQAEIVLHANLCTRNLPRARFSTQLPAQLGALSQSRRT